MIVSVNLPIFCSQTSRIKLPASKSQSNRALIISGLSSNPAEIDNLSEADDTCILKDILENPRAIIDVQHTGTAFRFLTAFLTMQQGEFVLTGSERLQKRPIKELVDTLIMLGAHIEYIEHQAYAPLKIKGNGPLKGGKVEIDSEISSQFISALLMIAPKMKNGLNLKLKGNSVSYSFIDLTLNMMKNQGIQILGTKSNIKIKPQEYCDTRIDIESDFASASYWFSILTQLPIGTKFIFQNFSAHSAQPDKMVIQIFSPLGIKSEIIENQLTIERCSSPTVNNLDIDLELAPDLAQTIMATCAALEIPLRISGLSTLPLKETNRLLAMQTELRKFGIELIIHPDYSIQQSGSFTRNNETIVETYKDHRMAMSFASIFIKNNGININDPEVVSKSYPGFWQELEKFAKIEFKNN